MNTFRRSVIVVLFAFAACGCATVEQWSMPEMPNVSSWFSRDNAVIVDEVRRAQVCNSPSPETQVWMFPDLAAARAWEAARAIQFIGEEPLPAGPYALVEMGTRNTAGYGVAVSRHAGRHGDALVLKATFVAPAPDRMAAQVVTSPCALVSLPLLEFSAVEVIDQDGTRRARSGGGS